MIVLRDFNRTLHDDLVLNVLPYLSKYTEAVPLYADNQIIGWKIRSRFQ